MSYPSSPHSSALPSPPSSPGSSFSSLPSSAFSLSVPSSPPHNYPHLPHTAHSLIIPSLSLDTTENCASLAPNLHGETLGHVKLLILGSKGSGKTFLAETLVHGNADVIEAGEWADEPGLGRVLSAAPRADGEPEEGAASVKLVEVAGFDQTDDPQAILSHVLEAIHLPFRAVQPLLSSTHPPDTALRDLLASPHSQFVTAALLLISSPPTALESTLLSTLSAHIPVIPVPSPSFTHTSRSSSRARTRAPRAPPSSVRPLTPHHLRTMLFRRPAALRTLRFEAAERFLWWREVESSKQQTSTLDALLSLSPEDDDTHKQEKWDWETRLSRDVALAREAAQKRTPECGPAFQPDLYSHSLDPLHVPSLFLLSLSLLRPLRDSAVNGIGMRWWAVTVMGAFCAGVGVGWWLGGV